MRAHIVPETYLASWRNNIGSNSVYVFNSKDYSCESKNLNVLNNTYFQQKDEYILKLEDCTGSVYQYLFNEIYSTISKKYDIKYKNVKINSGIKLRNSCRCLDNKYDWEISSITDGQRYKFNKFKDELKTEWSNKYNDSIEKFFCDQYETKWSSFIDFLHIKTKKSYGLLDLGDYEEYFIEFISLLLTRQYSNFEGYKKLITSLVNKYSIADNLTETNIRKIWLSQFFQFKKYKEKSSGAYKSNLMSLTVNYLKSKEISLDFLISKNINFFTSDNPVFRVEDKEKTKIYFPITKEICLTIIPKKRKYESVYKYYEVDPETVKEINDYIIKNSKQNFICAENNFESYCNLVKK